MALFPFSGRKDGESDLHLATVSSSNCFRFCSRPICPESGLAFHSESETGSRRAYTLSMDAHALREDLVPIREW